MTLTFPNINGNEIVHLDVLRSICGVTNDKSAIDIGSGFAPHTRQLNFKNILYLDVIDRDLKEENDKFLIGNILVFIEHFKTKKDISICEDVVEHFWKEDGEKIIKWMEENSQKQIIFTPQGRYMNVDDENNNDPDTHKYSWTDDQFQERGWATITFPHFHPTLGEGGLGAFFAFKCENLESEFNRAVNELKTKSWIK